MNTTESKSVLEQFTVVERAIIYARVSGDDTKKEGRNIESQLEMGREHCQEQNYRIFKELYEDPKKHTSGHEIDLPVLNQIREMARAGEFDVLVVRELDRLSRNLAKQLIVEEELNRAGVRIEYVLAEYADSPEGRLQKHLRATIAEYEREKIKERSVRGRRNKVKAGSVIAHGRPPYGFRLTEDKASLVVYEPEAAIIRLIFDWCVNEGVSIHAIARRLDEMGVPLPKNSTKISRAGWWMSTISRILRNEVYIGHWFYGKNGTQGKNERDLWLMVETPCIIPPELWHEAQEKLSDNQRFSKRNRKHDYLFSGRAACGCGCGYNLTGNSKGGYLYYSRMYGNKLLTICNAPYFRADHVDTVVWEWVKSLMTNQAKLAEGLAGWQAAKDNQNSPLYDRLKVVDTLLSEHKGKLARLLDVYLSGDIDKDTFVARKNQLETVISGLEREKGALVAQVEQDSLTEDQIQDITEFAEMIRADIQSIDGKFEAKRRIIDLLDTRVTLLVENGQKIAQVQCRLDKKHLPIMLPKRSSLQHNSQTGFVLTARLIIG